VSDEDRRIAEQLANPERSIDAIADALAEAAPIAGETERENVRALVDKLTNHDLEIDAVVIPRVLIALAVLFAAKTNTAPKQIFEQLWKDAPTDAWWHDRVNPTRGDDE